ncbi:MAG TPA: glycosyltransferase, partial [Terrimicrobiaceae bacterium]|nr:glycosyltransferase [Terrimicrobiaceae bacterium]
MRIAATGFVSAQAGSVASANALLLRGLLERGCEVDFFSKASFVDPRPIIGNHPTFRFFDVDNRFADRIRAKMERIPLAGKLASQADAATYNRLLVQTMNAVHAGSRFDLALWLGDYAAGPVAGIPTVSFAQGPPGTDARSLLSRFSEVRALAGSAAAWKWRAMASFRLSSFGLPDFRPSDRIIIGSGQSRSTLENRYGIARDRIRILPYPIDLEQFRLPG